MRASRKSEPKRILYVETNEDGSVGGSHQALYDLVRHIDRDRYEPVVLFYQDNVFVQRIRSLGWEVVLFEEERRRERALIKGAGLVRRAYGVCLAIWRRRKIIRDQRIDLVHINNSPAVAGDDWLPAARLAGTPIIANAMGDAEGTRGALQRWLFTKFGLVIAVSRYIEEAMIRHGVPDRRATTVNHGVDVEKIRSGVTRSESDVRRELGVPDGRVLVMMVGNIRRWKGQAVVLEALSRVPESVRDQIYVVFAGALRDEDRPYMEDLDRLVADHKLQACVSFAGYRTDVPDLLAASEIAVHASVVPEPGGIVVLEAMALDNAVIAASRGGHVEYLLPDYGLVHDVEKPEELAAALTQLVLEPSTRKTFATRARARVEEYSIQRNVGRFEKIYEQIFSE